MKKKMSLIEKSNRYGSIIEPFGRPVAICVIYTDKLFSIL